MNTGIETDGKLKASGSSGLGSALWRKPGPLLREPTPKEAQLDSCLAEDGSTLAKTNET